MMHRLEVGTPWPLDLPAFRVVDVELDGKPLVVYRTTDGKYHVVVDYVVRHPQLDAESVIRAMANYLQFLSYKLECAKALDKLL